jgi:RNA polymerase sigma-70 factor (ECF subfamily)
VSRDQDDFAEFFAASWDPCLRAVAASTGSMTLAEEQTAEAFARAWAAWRKISRHPAPKAWIVRTALNAGASWWRRRGGEVPLAMREAEIADTGHRPAPGTGLDASLLVALQRLPARQREVIALRVFLDLDVDSTARELGLAPGTVRAHQARAMAALRKEFSHATATETG